MEKIEAGKYIELVYEIFVVDGRGEQKSVFKFRDDRPDGFVYGMDPSLIEGFVRNIDGLEQGAKFDFTLAPAEAFGDKDPSLIAQLSREVFYVDGKFDDEHVKVGAHVPMMTQEGLRVEGVVTAIDQEHVTLDFNHQLAGETVRYVGVVKTVRDATPEELAPKHHHCGCGCEDCGGDGCGDHCGDGDCGCGDGDCGCGHHHHHGGEETQPL